MYMQRPIPKNHFLCEKHKEALANNPEHATTVWGKLIHSGRKKASAEFWQEAVILYGNAFEVAQLLFLDSPNKYEANRYVRTAVEFIFALRYSDYPANFELLVAAIRGCLETTLSPMESQKNVEPLMDIAFSPLCEVNRWMNMFYGMESSRGQTIH